jgi:hypothetical protein
MADPVLQGGGYQAVSVFSPKVYIVRDANRSSSALPPATAQRPALSPGRILAVQLQRKGDAAPRLTAVVDMMTGRIVQLVDTDQLEGLVISDGAGMYAVIGGT